LSFYNNNNNKGSKFYNNNNNNNNIFLNDDTFLKCHNARDVPDIRFRSICCHKSDI